MNLPDQFIFTPNQTIPMTTDKVPGTKNTHNKIFSLSSATTDTVHIKRSELEETD